MEIEIEIEKWRHDVSILPYFERRVLIARKIKPSLTRFLYKYKTLNDDLKSIKHVRDILVDGRLWLSAPKDFNDPFDMTARLILKDDIHEWSEYVGRILKEKGEGTWKQRKKQVIYFNKIPEHEKRKLLQESYDKNLNNFGVFSFAGDPRNILMWSHYANNHEGICMQFERAVDFAVLGTAIPVTYTSDYPIIPLPVSHANEYMNAVMSKHIEWEYEKENRIVLPQKANKYLNFNQRALKCIILGCKTEQVTLDIVESLLSERRALKLPDVTIYRAEKHESQYKIKITK